MTDRLNRRQMLRFGGGMSALALLAACDTTGFGFGPVGSDNGPPQAVAQTFGTGPVRVALLLPLSGDPAVSSVGISMANAAQLAMAYVSGNPRLGDNITLVLKDTGTTAPGAAQRASEAVSEGASLILGPLKADQVQAAGAVARSANIPLIGFSNNSSVAAPGIYLLNVLPESEVRRSLTYASDHGRKGIAAIFPNSDFGRVQQTAFTRAIADLHLSPRGAYTFSSQVDAQRLVAQLSSQLASGAIGALFLPDRATAPSFAALLQQAGIAQGKALLIGSADWDNDPAILATPYLAGAVYPAVDDAGYRALQPDYAARFGGNPHPLATIAYTATILANAAPLALANPRYNVQALTIPGGFNGRDGVFRFLPDGRSQYALVIKQVAAGGAVRVDGPKL
ncbi:MAG: penicillin-binding protein activator [Devosia sp.]|nr:penicillin-binding protein activator [Devosia sp.]